MLGPISGAAIGVSHNYVFDKQLNDMESITMATSMITKMYSYGAVGSIVKAGGDITYANHIVNEDGTGVFKGDSKYTESYNRFTYMKMKINLESNYADINQTGNNLTNGKPNSDYYGHQVWGAIFGSKIFFYGYEAWGEPYTFWEQDDFLQDGNSGSMMNGNYWDIW